jgi:hypothetical protein
MLFKGRKRGGKAAGGEPESAEEHAHKLEADAKEKNAGGRAGKNVGGPTGASARAHGGRAARKSGGRAAFAEGGSACERDPFTSAHSKTAASGRKLGKESD